MRTQLAIYENRISSLEAQLSESSSNIQETKSEHDLFSDSIIGEYERQKQLMTEEAEEANNGPKDISLFCSSNPQVRIVDLDKNLIGKNICLQLQIGSPELQTRLLLYCDGSVNMD
ncbi:hypothetical protein JH06_5141 [Blastocystis sp. subtype 4]|uniref:hypothetical protein n=1 Tax=Blastocystis sp. subtype 4 TaxID=944170 RepID=UPI000711E855|nr:hypothetical protein JH06_5141 [Blastocystis sp. subtype 4]KNB41468.1 hypothetical protein JH06_5141 [Blastocystis sp. subtype 4]|eukprot:XP_014524911.1 hypothetical protein JH06_5141 [Blastocystis sp. subtype 4]